MDSIFAIVGRLSEQQEYERTMALMLEGYNITQCYSLSSAHTFVLFCTYTKNPSQAPAQQIITSPTRGNNTARVEGVAVARLDNKDTLVGHFKHDSLLTENLDDLSVLRHCYQQWGADFCKKLEGDFCYALWDDDKTQLHLARNTFNARSLYYLPLGGALFVACDAKILSRHPNIKLTLNKTAVLQWLSGRPDPDVSMFNEIPLLPAGHRLEFCADGGINTQKFWDIEPGRSIRYQNDDDYQQHFLGLLQDSVAARLSSPAATVFSQMSGGMDSTSVTALAAQICAKNSTTLHTLSHLYQHTQSCDERDNINDMISTLSLKNSHFIDLDQYQSIQFSQLYPTDYDSPGIVLSPKYHQELSLIRSLGAEVLLTGNGGDETCWGHSATYRTRLYKGEVGVINEVVKASRDLQQPVARSLYTVFVSPLMSAALQQLLAWIRNTPHSNGDLPPWLGTAAQQLDCRMTLDNPYSRHFSPAKHARYHGIKTTSTYNSMRSYQKVADEYGVDVRHPFFDQKIMEFSFAIPEKMLIQGAYPKWLLRKTMQNHLPKSVCWNKHKTVFDHHFANLVRNNKDELRQLLSHTGLQDLGLLDNKVLLAAFDNIVDSKQGSLNVDMLYAILTQLWFQSHWL
ncbi:MAG: asparagine synthase (glutamine-hydrolyzing) [Paraglaciecola sp.]|jgi:asparagine synthase (glutamine-hydrolysing)